MIRLGDDELSSILKWIPDRKDKYSFSLVSKRWCRVEGSNRSSLRVLEPEFLHHFLPRFPNLLMFGSSKKITNHQIHFLANTCPRIQELNLDFFENMETLDESSLHPVDFDDDGISAIAVNCPNLSTVRLRSRIRIGSPGIIALVRFSTNLMDLNLAYCTRINDEALEAIGMLSCLRNLNLQGCYLITDLGLDFLGKGVLPNTLEILVLSKCDRITDNGLMNLRKFKSLVLLSLLECGPRITDISGIKAIAVIKTLKSLDLSWLINISNDTIFAISENCKNLVSLALTGCEMITGDGICALAKLQCLYDLRMAYIGIVRVDDLQHLLTGCQFLKQIVMDQRLKMWIPASLQEIISMRKCNIFWKFF